jgi:pyruvate formate-lyase/glycerol dehydratase family glycyl radical enzyme
MKARVADIRARALRSQRGPDPEADRLRQESMAETEGEQPVLREARAFAHHCRNRTVVIHDGELIVGAQSCMQHAPVTPTTPKIFNRQTLTCPWPVQDDLQLLFREGLLSGAGNHTTMDYETILAVGFEGLIDRVRARLARLSPDVPEDAEKCHFLEALEIVAEGYIDLCSRYADHAQALAAASHDETRSEELRGIAEICRQVPAGPPTNFREACQAVWFCFFFLPDAPGRVDQYLYPFYRDDIARNAITPNLARELLSCLWIKYFEFAGAQAGVSAHQHLTLGGVKPDGSDASNELTWMCLEVTEELLLHRPQVGLRWNRNTPEALLERAVRVLRKNSGNPDFCNDEQIVPALVKIGISQEDARDFSLSGCHEVIVTGRAQMGSVEGFINLPKVLRTVLGLEPALHDGAELEGIDSYEAFWDALKGGMAFAAEGAHRASVERDRQAAEIPGGNLAASLVVGDCIENACGYTQGGARYNHCNWDVIGIANLADALAAIKRLVFEEKELSLYELAKLLDSDWEGQESLRVRIVNQFPHFGNDQDDIDGIAARIIEEFSAILKERRPFRGGDYVLGTTAGGENMHIEFGRVTGATPDGRADGDPLADSLGAAQGRDRQGVTALLNSVAKLPHSLLPTATTLNVKLDPKLLLGDAGVSKIASLIRGHFLAGGQQCQFNLVNREMLLEAKRCPEEHSDLMVRVAGYSAPFTSLWEDLQEEIIARTEHAM